MERQILTSRHTFRPAVLWILLSAAAASSQTAKPAIPKQVPGVRPCPNITKPRTITDSGRQALELQVKMDIDVDGAPNAYGPRGKKTLDILDHALSPKVPGKRREVVGYMTEYDGGPPTIQR